MPEPELILPDRDALLAYLNNPLPDDASCRRYRVKSVWLCQLIERIFDEKGNRFVYNADVYTRACDELGLPENIKAQRDQHFDLAAKTLDTLVYNAQKYVRSDWLKARGFAPLTQAMVDNAGETKRLIQLPTGVNHKVRRIGDRWYALLPRARHRALRANDGNTLARVVDKHSRTQDMEGK
jgi:hypothetical protein